MEQTAKLAAEVAAIAAPHADRHDIDGTFVVEGVAAARDLGYLAAPVPQELGGDGALTNDIAASQRVLARSCGSTALAASMHLHVVLAAAWRWRRGDAVVEGMLRRVGTDHIVVASTGGNDWTRPTTVAEPTDGGWRVSGRKGFVSIAPVADVAATFAVIGAAEPGADVIGFGLPLSAEGVTVEETWDAAGMRGTGSHDLVLDDVFVGEAQVTARRVWGELDRPLLVAAMHAWPVVYATYLGVAEGLVDTVVSSGRLRDGNARQVGTVDTHLQSADWALKGLLAELGDDPDPTLDNFLAVQRMKYTVTAATREIATIAAELAGGGSYGQRGPVDRMIRDLRASLYHPYTPEAILSMVGRNRLGLDPGPF